MTKLFGLGHIAQLHEIQSARLKRNQPGIGPEVEELIRRLRDGAVLGNQLYERTRQAKVLWDLGVGRALGFKKFEEYLATIPEAVPENDRPDLFDRCVLVDRRLGLEKMIPLLGLGSNQEVGLDFHDWAYPDVEFIWCQDGRKNRNKSVRACRDSFVKSVEIGMTAIEGVGMYVQDQTLLVEPDRHLPYFPGSVVSESDNRVGYLDLYGKHDIGFDWYLGDITSAHRGSASRRA